MAEVPPFVEGHWEVLQTLEVVRQMLEVVPFLVDHWKERRMLEEVLQTREVVLQMREEERQILAQPFVVVH